MNRVLSALVATCALLSANAACAETQITIAYTPNAEAAPIYVALEEGIFAKHGINAKLIPVPVNSTLPAAVMSGSVDLGTFTPTTFIQAVTNGIELQAVAGMTVTSHKATRAGIVVGMEGGITKIEELKGKKLGVPGIGAILDVLARRLLMARGVDPSSVSFTETAFPTQADILKGGAVDAVVSVDPFIGRIEGANIGKLVADLLDGVEDGQTAQFFGGSREWIEANPDTVASFRQAIAEASEFIKLNDDATRDAIGKYLKLPPPVLAKIALPATDSSIAASQLDWWVGIMKEQGLVNSEIDTATMIAK